MKEGVKFVNGAERGNFELHFCERSGMREIVTPIFMMFFKTMFFKVFWIRMLEYSLHIFF